MRTPTLMVAGIPAGAVRVRSGRSAYRPAEKSQLSCAAIDTMLGDGGKLGVSGFFFVERLLKHTGAIVSAQFLGPCDQRAVTRHLIVFDGLGRGDQGRIEYAFVADLLQPRSLPQ
jgi:hypothetical protein